MKIGIIGTGNVGGTLGSQWSAKGHEVVFGTRYPNSEKINHLLAPLGSNVSARNIRQAAGFGDVVVIAVPWSAVPDVLRQAGDLSGKVVIDATNALKREDGPVALLETSAAEEIAKLVPGAKVVKAFNYIGAEHLIDSQFGENRIDAYMAGDDHEAKDIVSSLAEELGFEAVDVGPLRNAKHLEGLAILWIHMASQGGFGRDIAFKLLRH